VALLRRLRAAGSLHTGVARVLCSVRGASLSRYEEESNVELHQHMAVIVWLSLGLA